MRPLYPLGRVGEADDIAAAVAFLASADRLGSPVTPCRSTADSSSATDPGLR